MSALPQPDFTPVYAPNQSSNYALGNQSHHQNPKIIQKKPAKLLKSQAFRKQHKLPQSLQALSILQKGSFGLALTSMAISIGFYASTVRIPKLWSQEYHHLENLQRQERQLIAINETIKYQIAHEASQDQQLKIAQPESAVFITPAAVEEKQISFDSQSESQNPHQLFNGNLAY